MDRISLPAHVIAAQQKLSVGVDGGITRDRLMVVHQQEIVPMIVQDPIVQEYMIGQIARQRNQDAINQVMGTIWFISAIVPLIIIPTIIYFGCRV